MKRFQFCIILMLFACLTMGATNQVKNIALNYSADDFKVVSLKGDTSCIISKTYELQSSMKAGEPCWINTSGNAVVSYQLAPNVNQAAIRIYDLNGRIIADQILSETNGQIEIAAQSWAKGTYVCMMTVDNKLIRAYKFVKK